MKANTLEKVNKWHEARNDRWYWVALESGKDARKYMVVCYDSRTALYTLSDGHGPVEVSGNTTVYPARW